MSWIASPMGVTTVDCWTAKKRPDGTWDIKGHWAGHRQARPTLRNYPTPPRESRKSAKRDYDQWWNWRLDTSAAWATVPDAALANCRPPVPATAPQESCAP